MSYRLFAPFLFPFFFSFSRHLRVWNSLLWLESGKAHVFTREVNLLAASVWKQRSIWFNESRHWLILLKTQPKEKKWTQTHEAFLCFYHQNGFVFDMSLSHRHTLLIFVHSLIPWLCAPTPRINHYLLMHWIHMCHIYYSSGKGRQADYLCNLSFTYFYLWHNLFLFSSSL